VPSASIEGLDKGLSVELYRKASRYIAMSFNSYHETPLPLNNIDAALDAVFAELEKAKASKAGKPNGSDQAEPETKTDDLDHVIKTGDSSHWRNDRSEAVWWVVHEMLRRGVPTGIIEKTLLDRDNGISAHIYDQGNPAGYAKRQIEQAQLNLEGSDEAPAFSEEALAIEFAVRYANELRYVAEWGKWFRWDGKRWQEDKTRKVFDLSRQVCRQMAKRANKGSFRKALASAKTRAAVLSLGSDDRRLAATVEQWDADPWLLNTPDGVVDLKTGQLRPATPEDYMTKMTAVAPSKNGCPLWYKFLNTVTGSSIELQKFLQVTCGYSLTGLTREQVVWFLFGGGRNGKSVFIKTIACVFGNYHTTASMEMFMESKFERHPTDLAGLCGARLVTAAETEEGRRWNESQLKAMTGGDRMKARFMRQDFFEYDPIFKLIFFGNKKPGLKSVDEAIRWRLKLTPFTVRIPDDIIDKKLAEKLEVEWPGILHWMIEGCLMWQRDGLVTPKIVTDATKDYFADEDALGRWLGECATLDASAKQSGATLYQSWTVWATLYNEYAGSSKMFYDKLESHNFKRHRIASGLEFIGLKLKDSAAASTQTAASNGASRNALVQKVVVVEGPSRPGKAWVVAGPNGEKPEIPPAKQHIEFIGRCDDGRYVISMPYWVVEEEGMVGWPGPETLLTPYEPLAKGWVPSFESDPDEEIPF
jgi:putative DNA primase/helicase